MADAGHFRGAIRYWRPERGGGLAVVDVPPDVADALGGLRQVRVGGTLNGVEFTSSTMPAGGGRLAMSVSKKMLDAAGIHVGDEGEFEVHRTEGR
jgi:Domain of unknown function (DUF1905)